MKPKKKATKQTSARARRTAATKPREKPKQVESAAPAEGAPRPKAARKVAKVPSARAGRTRAKSARRAAVVTPPAAPNPPGAEPASPPVEVPPILLEGDRPSPPPLSGPGRRYELAPAGSTGSVQTETLDLPEAYGTKALFLLPRDPHGLFVYWDFTRAQLAAYNQRAREGHMTLRVYRGERSGQPHVEVALPPEGRQWFLHVGEAGATYLCELGYYRKRDGAWVSVVTSELVRTPPEPKCEAEPVRFMTLPAGAPLTKAEALVARLVAQRPEVARAVAEAQQRGEPVLPAAFAAASPQWGTEQREVVESWIRSETWRPGGAGSLEVSELARRALAGWPTSPGGAAWSGAWVTGAAVSSPTGPAAAAPRGFWFNIHAELVVYGATEPDARVTLEGRPVTLRPDGSFSCRFVLPDGRYELEAVATKADGSESRRAVLRFSRQTSYSGEVHQAPADPALQPPPPERR